ncbi:extracellular solute-binding protein [Paenibacillus sp. DMB20]|uniref:extracellular solute-binding protein n=1 Tax=Paenibacillus sp. DMB20 TaxID=1642570 RepID=UPI000627855F|nr:extracellular solute-binding protein [Paenibacillus sp. DMB20]KKO50843.1 sugar ABC transporter substrate-binding protein [Paenibacillus sp. DMB20]
MAKKMVLLLLSLTVVLSLAACGPKRDAEQAKPDTDSAQQQEGGMPPKPERLKIWGPENEPELKSMQAITKKFTEKTGIDVEVVPFNPREQAKAFSLDGPADRGPDLWSATHNSMGRNVLQGLAEPFQISEEQISEYSPEAIQAVTIDGKIYNLPMVIETTALFYNKELMPKAPETWEELEKFALEFTDVSKDEYGLLFDATNFYYANMFLQGNGGYIFGYDKDAGYNVDDIGLNNEGAVKGANLIKSWFEKGLIPESINGDVIDGLFKEGKVAAVVSVPSSIKNYESALKDKLGAVPLPKLANGQRPPSFLGVKGLVLSPFSKHKEWATELALFITNDENGATHFEMAGEIPARPGILESDLITKHPYFSAVAEQAKFATPTPNNPEISQTWEPMKNALVFLAKGQNTKEVLDEAVVQIKEQIAINNANK